MPPRNMKTIQVFMMAFRTGSIPRPRKDRVMKTSDGKKGSDQEMRVECKTDGVDARGWKVASTWLIREDKGNPKDFMCQRVETQSNKGEVAPHQRVESQISKERVIGWDIRS